MMEKSEGKRKLNLEELEKIAGGGEGYYDDVWIIDDGSKEYDMIVKRIANNLTGICPFCSGGMYLENDGDGIILYHHIDPNAKCKYYFFYYRK